MSTLGQAAPIGEDVTIEMSNGKTYTGHFNSMTEMPYFLFSQIVDLSGNLETVYLNIEHIVAVYPEIKEESIGSSSSSP